jgi:hypothetical protein
MERVPSQREDMIELLRRPFDREGLLTALVLALPFGLTIVPDRLVALFFSFVYAGCLASFYFQTVDHVGRGQPGLPFSAAPVSRADLSKAVERGLACLAVAVGPAWAWSVLVPEVPLVSFALLALGCALAPAAIVTVAVTERALLALWPFAWARIIARAPSAYGRLVLLFFGSSAIWIALGAVASLTLGRIPLAGPLLAAAVNAVLATVQAVLVGGFIRRNATDLGVA